jgi:hypothetical protein
MSQRNSGTQGSTPEEAAEETAETARRKQAAGRPDGSPWLTNLGSISSYLLGVGGSALLFFGPPALRRDFWLWWLPVFLLLLVPREGVVGRVVMKLVGLVVLAVLAWSAWSSWIGPGSTARGPCPRAEAFLLGAGLQDERGIAAPHVPSVRAAVHGALRRPGRLDDVSSETIGGGVVAEATTDSTDVSQVPDGVGDPPWTRTMNPEIKSRPGEEPDRSHDELRQGTTRKNGDDEE